MRASQTNVFFIHIMQGILNGGLSTIKFCVWQIDYSTHSLRSNIDIQYDIGRSYSRLTRG